MTVIFDGKAEAIKLEKDLISKNIFQKNKPQKMVSIQVGDNRGSELYLLLKQKAAERMGLEMQIIRFAGDASVDDVIKLINQLNNDREVNGIMVQLPFPEHYSKAMKDLVVNSIIAEKDVDGMRSDSHFDAPVVLAVLHALNKASEVVKNKNSILVVGCLGFVGNKILDKLKSLDIEAIGIDLGDALENKVSDCDVVISATGNPKIIKSSWFTKGSVAIDVGFPDGDIDTTGSIENLKFLSPVPGGIGPLTIYFLMENLVKAGGKFNEKHL